MKEMLIVIKETYLRHIKSWTFFFMVISPFLFLGISAGIGYLQGSALSGKGNIALVTTNSSLKEAVKDEKELIFDYKDEKAAQKALKDEGIKGYIVLEEKEGQIQAVYHGEAALDASLKSSLSSKLMTLQQSLNLVQAQLSQAQVQALSRTISFSEKIDQNKEEKKMVQTLAAAGIGLLLYMILITYSSVTAQEIASEKGTKIMEVIFSSIKAQDYFLARMLGILAVILTHIGIYLVGGLLLVAFADQISFVKDFLTSNPTIAEHLGEAVSLNTVAFVILSIFLYVVLSAFLGSTISRAEDASKVISPLMMLIMVGFFGVTALGSNGDSLPLQIGSFLPFISTFFMPFRTINGYASGLESWLSFGVNLTFTVLATAFISRIYASLALQTDDLGAWKTLKRALSYK